MRLIDLVKSAIAAIRASAALGRAYKSQRKMKWDNAQAYAQEGLVILRAPYVFRSNPGEGAALASLTILAEQLAEERVGSGAKLEDIKDALSFLKSIDDGNTPSELCSFISYLESRLDRDH